MLLVLEQLLVVVWVFLLEGLDELPLLKLLLNLFFDLLGHIFFRIDSTSLSVDHCLEFTEKSIVEYFESTYYLLISFLSPRSFLLFLILL